MRQRSGRDERRGPSYDPRRRREIGDARASELDPEAKRHLSCGRGELASTSGKRKRKRRLWGSDDGGSFQTHGRDSVATVRGTNWLTVDTCSGTLTRVLEGAVSVRPRGKGKTVLVKAGQRHFVRHR